MRPKHYLLIVLATVAIIPVVFVSILIIRLREEPPRKSFNIENACSSPVAIQVWNTGLDGPTYTIMFSGQIIQNMRPYMLRPISDVFMIVDATHPPKGLSFEEWDPTVFPPSGARTEVRPKGRSVKIQGDLCP